MALERVALAVGCRDFGSTGPLASLEYEMEGNSKKSTHKRHDDSENPASRPRRSYRREDEEKEWFNGQRRKRMSAMG